MKFKSFMSKEPKHKATAVAVDWSNSEELYSCSDDHVILKWNLASTETTTVLTLPTDFFPTDLHCCPKVLSGSIATAPGKQVLDTIVICSADGRFFIINKSGRVEKKVEAHKGAILSGKWSPDGASILTAGEDGHIRIWSRGGMLRSTVVQGGPDNMRAQWGTQGSSIIHSHGRCISVKSLAANTKGVNWRAHDALVSCLSYSPASDLIASGGEDGRYRVWTIKGKQLYSSSAQNLNSPGCIAWSPSGDCFAVGGYNSLRLCDKAGWSHAVDKSETGSLYSIAWSQDGTQVAAACANGHVLFTNVIEKQLCKYNYSILLQTARTLLVTNISDTAINELIELPDRVANFHVNSSHLVVTTPTQCHVFKTEHWNTPLVIELREGCAAFIQMTNSNFALVERNTVSVYSYTGRLLLNPRWPNMQSQPLGAKSVSLGADLVVVKDQSDQKAIHLFDISASPMAHHGTSQGTILKHSVTILNVCVSQMQSDAAIAVLDSNHDLYIVPYGENKFYKIGMQAVDMIWCSEANMLSAVQESRITIWFCPLEASASTTLLSNTDAEHDIGQFGARPNLVSFDRSILNVQRMDGAIVCLPLPVHFSVLHGFVINKQWEKALRLCRLVKDHRAWWSLAAMASYQREMDICLQAFAATQSVDRVAYIQHIKDLPPGPQQIAESLLLIGRQSEAESVLLHSGNVAQVVALCVKMHNWERALELSQKHKMDIISLLSKRQEYLTSFNKVETNEKYLQAIASIENS